MLKRECVSRWYFLLGKRRRQEASQTTSEPTFYWVGGRSQERWREREAPVSYLGWHLGSGKHDVAMFLR